jgi:hypothetical protein
VLEFMSLDVRVLGPARLLVGGEPVAVGGPKPRAVQRPRPRRSQGLPLPLAHHAEPSRAGLLEGLRSANGVYVNEQPIETGALPTDGDVRIDVTGLTFQAIH